MKLIQVSNDIKIKKVVAIEVCENIKREKNKRKIVKKYIIKFFYQKVPNKKRFANKYLIKFFLFQRVPSKVFLLLAVKYKG